MKIHCTNCHFEGKAKKITKGSFFIEVALWLFFLFPGLIYSLWRMTSKYWACPDCKSSNIIELSKYKRRIEK